MIINAEDGGAQDGEGQSAADPSHDGWVWFVLLPGNGVC